MRDETKVPDIMIDRAVDIWCRALARPKFDNGDNSERGFIGMGMAAMTAERQIANVDDYNAAIERFRVALSTRLKFIRDHEGEPMGDLHHQDSHKTYYLDRFLGCDYHPDPDLRAAADEAGIPHRAFSYKSDVAFWTDSVSSKFGYGAPYDYHYPLADGSWLVTKLRGEDMPAIMKAAEEGRLPELTIEPKEGAS